MPITPEALGTYLIELFQSGHATKTAAIILTVARKVSAGGPDPTDNPIVRDIWKGFQRTRTEDRRTARYISLAELAMMVNAIPAHHGDRGARDRAMLIVGWCGALRRSELVALRWSDLEDCPDGLICTIWKSKTDQEQLGVKIGLPWARQQINCCPVRALAELAEICKPILGELFENGPIFLGSLWGGIEGRKLTDQPADPKAVSRAVKRAARLAKLPKAKQYSAHSLRRGLATECARAGRSDRSIMRHGRWQSREMLDRYVQDGTIFEGHPLIGLL